MAARARLGSKVRSLRRREGLTQAQLAERLGISASYLNLIEHDKRPLTAPLLIALARRFDVDVEAFAADEEAQLVADLMEVFGDPLFDDAALSNVDVRELTSASPAAARAVLRMYQALRASRETAESLAARLHDDSDDGRDPLRPAGSVSPSEDVTDLLHKHRNHFPALEAAAESLWRDAGLERAPDLFGALSAHLSSNHNVNVRVVDASAPALRRFDEASGVLELSELLPPRSRNFQVAHQLALIGFRELLDEVAEDGALTSDVARRLSRVALANYFAGCVLMPYAAFKRAAEEVRYDVELLGHRFRTSFEQVCHRLTTLSRPGEAGVPFHFVRVDVAGNISKRYSGSGIRFARYAGACPKWNVFGAFLTPGMIKTQLSRMPDGSTYFCVARTIRTTGIGFHHPQATYAVGLGCAIEHAPKLVYADGINLQHAEQLAVPIGVTCRLCERLDCPQRAFPPLTAPLDVDEHVRGQSFYAPPAKARG